VSVDWPLVVSGVAMLAAISSAIYAREKVKKIKSQLQQTSIHHLTDLSNRSNWDLFDRREHLPPALPSWIGLSDSQWAWRVLHLNHLNLLQLAYQDRNKGLTSQQEFESWVLKARFWFRNLWAEIPTPEFQDGREVLRQILRPEEGYPKEFRQWLVDENVIPPDLVSD
jgi:hypothetical protein